MNITLKTWISIHRKAGLFCAAFVFILSTTGILLIRSESLQLEKSGAPAWIVEHIYGLPKPKIQSHTVQEQWWSCSPRFVYLQDQSVGKNTLGELQTAFSTPFGVGLHFKKGIIYFNGEGEWIETLTCGQQLPNAPITGVFCKDEAFQLFTAQNSFSSSDGFEWIQDDIRADMPMETPKTDDKAVPEHLIKNIQNAELSSAISWERLMLDLHSGRAFGAIGPLLMELSAWGLLLLTITGLWLFKAKPSKPKKRTPLLKIKREPTKPTKDA